MAIGSLFVATCWCTKDVIQPGKGIGEPISLGLTLVPMRRGFECQGA